MGGFEIEPSGWAEQGWAGGRMDSEARVDAEGKPQLGMGRAAESGTTTT